MGSVKLGEGINYGELQKKADLGFAWVSLTSYGEYDRYEKHYHENPYLSMVVKGCYTESNNKELKKLSKGELVYRPADYDHSNTFIGEPGVCFNIELKAEWTDLTDDKFKLPKDFVVFDCGTHTDIQRALYQFISNASEANIKEDIFNWLHKFNDSVTRETRLLWVEKAKKIIESESEQNHSLETLAERLHIHPVYFAGSFKKKTGLTVGEFIMKERIKKADQLLFKTKLPINEIAAECGFYDPAHFIRNYHKVYNVSPARFRKAINS